MSYCGNCGTKNPENSRFCESCGEALEGKIKNQSSTLYYKNINEKKKKEYQINPSN